MTKIEWFFQFDKTKDNFKWFWEQYFPGKWEQLLALRENDDIDGMINSMNDVWFWLPDNKFNIMVNPKGWNEFLYLVEQ